MLAHEVRGTCEGKEFEMNPKPYQNPPNIKNIQMDPEKLKFKNLSLKNFGFRTSLNQRSKFFGQLELPIERKVERDRNADLGGRSFYFFDFDDNVAFLTTPSYIFHKETKKELQLSSGEFAQMHRSVGKSGIYRDYQIDLCEQTGTFRNFRDKDLTFVEKLLGKKQGFVTDLAAALGHPDFHWKGPSWNCFQHAALNQRPLAVITARGHSAETIREGISLFVKEGHIPLEPNYLAIYPVSNKKIRAELGDEKFVMSTAELKKAAIRKAVEQALDAYGYSPHHRFGMSDDDPHNIELITSEMKVLKTKYPEMSFFIIETHKGQATKWEVYPDHTEASLCADVSNNTNVGFFEQLSLKL